MKGLPPEEVELQPQNQIVPESGPELQTISDESVRFLPLGHIISWAIDITEGPEMGWGWRREGRGEGKKDPKWVL